MDVLGNTNQLLLIIVLPKPVLFFMLIMKNMSIQTRTGSKHFALFSLIEQRGKIMQAFDHKRRLCYLFSLEK